MIIILIILISALYFVIRNPIYIVTVNGVSMYPTLHDGDRVIVWRDYPTHWLRNGQIVLSFINYAEQEYRTLKRVFGLPGDVVTTFDQPSLIDPIQCSEIQIHNDINKRLWHIPKGHFFIKGDYVGVDSRMFGPIPFSSLQGVVILNLSRRSELYSPSIDLVEHAVPFYAEMEESSSQSDS